MTEATTPSPRTSGLGPKLLRVAWLAILLGLLMEALLLSLGTSLGKSLGLEPLAADLVKNVSWSVFVCAGLALGTTISKLQIPAMGFLGLLTAPLAFEVSRALHKGTLGALSASEAAAAGPSPLVLALVKGVEYGCLGLAVGWVMSRRGGLLSHVAVGLAIGLAFGGAIVGLTLASTPPPPTADVATRALNEILFPIGCSLVLFAAGVMGEKASESKESRDDEEGANSPPPARNEGSRSGRNPRTVPGGDH